MNHLKINFIILFFTCYNLDLKSAQTFDIITLSYNNITYYLETECLYEYNYQDFKYYHTNNKFAFSIETRVLKCLNERNNFKIFKSLDSIKLNKFDKFRFDSNLYILKEEILHIPADFQNKFKVLNVKIGSDYGYIYTGNLKSEDNEWIQNNNIVELFEIRSDDNYCLLVFYSIKDLISKEKIEQLFTMITNLNGTTYECNFKDLLNILYMDKIIMIGSCSC